jgi:hypothetical protein
MLENIKPLDFTPFFTPFMLGSISLIAYLSVRNGFLATKTREICKELALTKDDLWQWSYLLQLDYFVHRYKLNNLALMLAILGVFFFGLMIACSYLMQIVISSEKSNLGSSFFLLFGGICSTTATIISIYETYKGRNSLFAYVATTIVKLELIEQSKYTFSTSSLSIEKIIKKHLESSLQDELKEKVAALKPSI